MKKLKVAFISAEVAPLAKVGGLADVAGALPIALKKAGVDVRVIMPKYSIVDTKKYKLKKIATQISIDFDSEKKLINIWQCKLPNSQTLVYLIENKEYFGKGGVYPSPDASSNGSRHEVERFGFLSQSAISIFPHLKWQPKIVHCQDWHVGITPLLIKKSNNKKINKLKTLATIHNLAYQGWYDKKIIAKLFNLSEKIFSEKKSVSTLRQAILNADLLNTVSEKYAKEILTKEFGCDLENDLKKRKRDLKGIVNGIDLNFFNPEKDKFIKAKYSIKNINSKKPINKLDLQKLGKLPQDKNIPLIGIVTRLAEQKGFDIFLPIIEDLLKQNLQIIILGTGDKNYEEKLKKLAKKYPTKLSANIKFDAGFAQKIYAGSDIFLMPSRFEPCGLGQMIAMRYGTLPIVRKTGGLADTVKNMKTGFVFKKYSDQAFLKAIQSALKTYQKKSKWDKMIKQAMKQDFSWNASAEKYIELYKKLVK